jgi:hypothetical protein
MESSGYGFYLHGDKTDKNQELVDFFFIRSLKAPGSTIKDNGTEFLLLFFFQIRPGV